MGKFSDGGGFTHAIHADHHDDIRLFDPVFDNLWNHEVRIRLLLILLQHLGDFIAQEEIKLVGTGIFLLRDTHADALDDLDRCINTDVAGNQDVLQFVEHFLVDTGFADQSLAYL